MPEHQLYWDSLEIMVVNSWIHTFGGKPEGGLGSWVLGSLPWARGLVALLLVRVVIIGLGAWVSYKQK